MFQNLVQDNNYNEYLGSDIWLVDNHKWAFYIWQEQGIERCIDKFSLIHIDYHWDGGYDFHNNREKEEELKNSDLSQIHDFVSEEIFIRYDSFIAPAIVRGLVDDVHFYCLQDDNWGKGIDDELIEEVGASQTIHDDMGTLLAHKFQQPYVFDFCLDIFNKTDMYLQGDIWSDAEINNFLISCEDLVRNAELVTVSLSFGYSGTVEDTRRLAEKAVPMFQEWRSDDS